jgi:hypothetical protein
MDSFLEYLMAIGEYMANDCKFMGFPKIVDAPKGTRQASDSLIWDYEYVDQSCGISGDDYHGTMYFPLPNGKYLSVEFSC